MPHEPGSRSHNDAPPAAAGPGKIAPGFAFDFDRQHGLMRIEIRGFWDAATVDAFLAEGVEIANKALRTHPNYDTLLDARDFPVQAAQITEGLANIIRVGMEMNTGRSAVLSGSQLGKMQGDRINSNPRLKFFLAEPEALAWLAKPAKTDP